MLIKCKPVDNIESNSQILFIFVKQLQRKKETPMGAIIRVSSNYFNFLLLVFEYKLIKYWTNQSILDTDSNSYDSNNCIG